MNEIICSNCTDITKKWPNEYVDLVVTSPPYDNLRDYKGYDFDFENIAHELYRILKKGGVIVWIVGDATIKGSETGSSFRQVLFFKELGLNLHDTMIYAKTGFSKPSSNRYHQVFEYMFILSKNKPRTFNPIKDKPNKWAGHSHCPNLIRQKDGSLRRAKKQSTLSQYGMRYNIWEYSTGRNHCSSNPIAYNHPAIFSEQLVIDHIKSWSNKGDLVFDPMCGSGTTCFAAKQLGRKYIGIDISEEYCEIARERLKDV